ncbi:hypothetical protein BGX30_013564, partial [Mortierella sp. GBA39]
VSFDISYSGMLMGKAVVDNMVLAPGANTLPAEFHLAPADSHVRDAFLSGFVAGMTFNLGIAGGPDSTDVESLHEAMQSVKTSASITGITDKLIGTGSTAVANIWNMLQITDERSTPVQVMIYNPFDAPLYIKSMYADTTWNGMAFGTVNQDVGMTVPPKSSQLSPVLYMMTPAGAGFMDILLPFIEAYPKMMELETVDVPFLIESQITAVVGGANGYLGNVAYAQPDAIFGVRVSYDLKPPGAVLPPALGGPAAVPTANTTTTTTTTTEPSTATTLPEQPTATPTTADTITAPASATASPTTTVAAVAPATVVKRQAAPSILETGPLDQSPEQIEAWLKAMVNNLAVNQGLAAPY